MKTITASIVGTILLLVLSGVSMASYIITDDATGGDCILIGTWDASTKTCTLTTDIYISDDSSDGDAIIIGNGSNITLDGNGHTLTGPGPLSPLYVYSHGVWVIQRPGTTVKNFNITGFFEGINLHFSNDSKVICNDITDSRQGIHVTHSYNAKIIGNNVTGSSFESIFLVSPQNSDVIGNIVNTNGHLALRLMGGSNTSMIGNAFLGNNYSFDFSGSSGHKFYNNNLFNSNLLLFGSGVTLNLDDPIGGNYWDAFDTPEEGCNDLNGDGFCDLPYYAGSGIDYLPLAAPFEELLAYKINGAIGNNDWYVSNVQIDLYATDCTSVNAIHYILDGVETVVTDNSASIVVDTDGQHEFTFWAVDSLGNPEQAKTVNFKSDKTSPTVFVDADPKTIWPPNGKLVDVLVTGYADDAASGLASTSITVTDEYGVYNMSVPGFGSTIQLEAWVDNHDPDGRKYTIKAVATDNAGNQSSSTVDVVVTK